VHEVEARSIFFQLQLQNLRRIGKSVANDRTGLSDAKGNNGGVGTQLAHEVELLVRLLEANLAQNFLSGGWGLAFGGR
jgi:hypothetical protein